MKNATTAICVALLMAFVGCTVKTRAGGIGGSVRDGDPDVQYFPHVPAEDNQVPTEGNQAAQDR